MDDQDDLLVEIDESSIVTVPDHNNLDSYIKQLRDCAIKIKNREIPPPKGQISGILIAVVLVGARIYFRAPVSGYYKASEKAFVIPGLLDNMTPQGFDYDEASGMYLIGGYQKDHSPSRIYRVEKASGKSNGYVAFSMYDAKLFEGI